MAAIPPLTNNWKPIGENFLDLRLTQAHTESEKNLIKLTVEVSKMNLKALYTQSSTLKPSDLLGLAVIAPSLEKLNLSCYSDLNEETIRAITQLKSLTELNLNCVFNCQLLDSEQKTYIVETINDKALELIIQSCPKIQKIDLSYSTITAVALTNLLSLKDLKFIRIYSCPLIISSQYQEFIQKKPSHVTVEIGKSNDPTENYIQLFHLIRQNCFFWERSTERYRLKEVYRYLPIATAPFNVGYL